MKAHLKRAGLLGLVAVLGSVFLPAALLACGEKRAERVVIHGSYTNDHDPQQNLGLYGGYCDITLGPGSASGTGDTGITGDAFLYPGKVYTLAYAAEDATSVNIYLRPPPGYDLFIDGVQQTAISEGGSGSSPSQGTVYYGSYQVELRDKVCGAPAGVATPLKVGEVMWEVGIGRLRNGELAGKIMLHEHTFSSGVLSRGALHYGSISTDVDDIRDGTGLRQILAPETFVNIHSITGGFQLDFYAVSAVTGTSGGLYTFSGTPFAQFKITDGGASNRIKVEKISGNYAADTVANYNPASGGSWDLNDAQARIETRTNATVNGLREETVTTYEPNGTTVVAVVKNIYNPSSYYWGETLEQRIEDFGAGRGNYTTTYKYHYGTGEGSQGKLKSTEYPGGGWVRHEYYESGSEKGQVHKTYRNWTDNTTATVTNAHEQPNNCDVTTYTYATGWFDDVPLPASSERKILGTTVAKQEIANVLNQTANGAKLWIRTQKDYFGAGSGDYVTTVIKTYGPDQNSSYWFYKDKNYSVARPDGTQDSYVQLRGTYNTGTKTFTAGSGDDEQEIVLRGTTGSVSGATYTTSFASTTIEPLYLVPGLSTQGVTIRKGGNVVREETYAYVSSAFQLVGWTDYGYTASGKLSSRAASNGATWSAGYTNEFMTTETDETGVQTDYSPDARQFVSTATRTPGSGYSGATVPAYNIYTNYTYNAAGQVAVRQTTGSGSLSLTTSTAYNYDGQVSSRTEPGTYVTSYSYNVSSSPNKQTTTYPGGATTTTEVFPDGQLKSLSGTAQVAERHVHTVNGTTGNRTTQVYYGTASSTTGHWRKTEVDWLGRKVKDSQPDTTATAVDTTYTYNSLGQLAKVSVARSGTLCIKPTIYAYSALGARTVTALDVDGDDTIDYGGTDRISKSETAYTYSDSKYWLTTTDSVYATDSSSTATTVQTTAVQLTGYSGTTRAVVKKTDVNGNVTTQTTTVDAYTRVVTVTTDTPDSATDAVQISYNGLLIRSTDALGLLTTIDYDGLGRAVKTTHPRLGGRTTTYPTTSNKVSKVSIDGGPDLLTYSYDSAGRVALTVDTASRQVYSTYNDRGQLVKRWGNGTLPVKYDYDEFGRMISQSTYRGETSGYPWTASAWPTTEPTADTTVFDYHGDLPLLEEKRDASYDYDPEHLNFPTLHNRRARAYFAYDALGRMTGRTNGRGITTNYNFSEVTGDLTSVTYTSDTTGTPAVTYTYRRTGAIATVKDGTAGGTSEVRTFYSTRADGQPEHEELPATFFSGHTRLTYSYATSTGVVGRPTAMKLGTSGSPTADQDIAYTYDSVGRLSTITPVSGQIFTYGYEANERLVASVSTGSGSSAYVDTIGRVDDRDWVESRATTYGGASAASFDYVHDDIGRITAVSKTSAANGLFSRYGDGTQGLDTYYSYDARSQLTAETTKLGGSSTVLTGRTEAYAYDHAGNRSTTTHNGNTATYTANALNQYTQRTVPGVVDVTGALNGATVTVTGGGTTDTATRHGKYFFAGYAWDNSSNIGEGTLTATDGSSSAYTPVCLPETPQTLSYDIDGNLTGDGRWNYAYDAENRLITMETTSEAESNGFEREKITFTYDYLGRRVQKVVETTWNGTEYEDTVLDQKFVWHGWLLIAKLNAASSNAIMASHYWGLDLSGTGQGAGGVGGLLLTKEHGSGITYLPVYDAIGNVHAMLKASTGSIEAAYEYDAFGRTLRADGAYATGFGTANPFRFSTKYTDETGLVYYGHRHYSPDLGRFLNRDPIGELGGLNLYGLVGNNPVNGWDLLGLDAVRLPDMSVPASPAPSGPINAAEAQAWRDELYDYISGVYDFPIPKVDPGYRPEIKPPQIPISCAQKAVEQLARDGKSGNAPQDRLMEVMASIAGKNTMGALMVLAWLNAPTKTIEWTPGSKSIEGGGISPALGLDPMDLGFGSTRGGEYSKYPEINIGHELGHAVLGLNRYHNPSPFSGKLPGVNLGTEIATVVIVENSLRLSFGEKARITYSGESIRQNIKDHPEIQTYINEQRTRISKLLKQLKHESNCF